MDDKTADRRSELENAERREKRILFMVSGVIAPALAPVVFVWVVVNTMEPSDRIPGWGPCPTTEGVAAGAAGAGVLVVIACVLVGRLEELGLTRSGERRRRQKWTRSMS